VLKKVAGDESWHYEDDPVTKRQHGVGVEKNSSKPKTLQFQKSCVKMMLITGKGM